MKIPSDTVQNGSFTVFVHHKAYVHSPAFLWQGCETVMDCVFPLHRKGMVISMKNVKLVLEYDGSRYDGWQKQSGSSNSVTIQDKIESVLCKMEGEEIQVIGAARTEAGVHALGQIANFKTNSSMKIYEIKQYLNRFLPRDIGVLEAMEVPERFHSAFSANSFTYEYRIETGEVPSVFSRKYQYYCFHPLNLKEMKKAADSFIGKDDFKALSDNKRMKKSTIRELSNITVSGEPKGIIITVSGDDFWPHMVRILVGTLMEVGLGKIHSEDIPDILKSGNRELAGPAAEAKGLFLKEVSFL